MSGGRVFRWSSRVDVVGGWMDSLSEPVFCGDQFLLGWMDGAPSITKWICSTLYNAIYFSRIQSTSFKEFVERALWGSTTWSLLLVMNFEQGNYKTRRMSKYKGVWAAGAGSLCILRCNVNLRIVLGSF